MDTETIIYADEAKANERLDDYEQLRAGVLRTSFALEGIDSVFEKHTSISFGKHYLKDGYEKWLDHVIDSIPDWMTRVEFIDIYDGRLAAEYQKQVIEYRQQQEEEDEE